MILQMRPFWECLFRKILLHNNVRRICLLGDLLETFIRRVGGARYIESMYLLVRFTC